MKPKLTFQVENRIAVVELTEAVDSGTGLLDLADDFSEHFRKIRNNAEIKAIVLTDKAENALSMGKKIIRKAVLLDETAWKQTSILAESIVELAQPVIAAISGDATGFGLELILACDIRIAAATSMFALPHVKTHLLPWCGGSQRLPRIVGRGNALEMILTGEPIDAQTAERIGLISRVVPSEELMPETMKMAKTLVSKGSLAMGYIKEAVNKGMDLTLDQGLRLEADLYYLLHTTGDRTEGVKAFQERRKPNFEDQ